MGGAHLGATGGRALGQEIVIGDTRRGACDSHRGAGGNGGVGAVDVVDDIEGGKGGVESGGVSESGSSSESTHERHDENPFGCGRAKSAMHNASSKNESPNS